MARCLRILSLPIWSWSQSPYRLNLLMQLQTCRRILHPCLVLGVGEALCYRLAGGHSGTVRSLSVLAPTHASPSCEQPTQQVDGAVHDHVEGFGRELGVAGRPRLVAATLQRSPRGDVPRIAVRHVRHESPRRG